MIQADAGETIRSTGGREHIRIVAVIAADAGAARPPDLWPIVQRLRACRLLEEIAVATTANPRDEAIVEWCNAHGVPVLRGPEDDMLGRFATAAEKLDADILVRASCGAPLPDPDLVDHLVATLIEQSGDYVLPEDGAAHDGVDVFSRRALDRLMMDAPHDKCARQQVAGYFRRHPGFVKVVRAAAFAPPEPVARTQGPGGLALIRCDGGGKYGYGHVKRMVSLARALRDREGIGALFALNGTEDAAEPIRRAGFDCAMLHGASDLETLVDANAPDILLLDGREGPGRAELEKLKRGVAVTAVMDDGHDRRLAADYAYYPPVPGARALDWSGSRALPRIGWEWALLGLNPSAAPPRAPASRPTVLVAMGGSDPHGLTLRTAKALAALDPVFRIRFVIGAGMKDAALVARGLVALKRNYETVEGAADLSTEYACADVALCAFGVTAYELAVFGVPAVYLGLTPDHAASAQAFADAGMGISLGVADRAPDADIAATVQWLLNKPAVRREMRARGPALLDGQGASRVAADLASALQHAKARAA